MGILYQCGIRGPRVLTEDKTGSALDFYDWMAISPSHMGWKKRTRIRTRSKKLSEQRRTI